MTRNKLPRGLYAIVDDGVRPDLPVVEKARAVVEGGVSIVQLRLKRTPDRLALAELREVLAFARPLGVCIIIDDRVDLALVARAHGVHLGASDLPAQEARRLLGAEALIGLTTRTLADVEQARLLGVDYVGLGPVFATRTKLVDAPPIGVERFAAIVQASPLPVVGIAGITLENVASVAAAGAWGAAVASDLFASDDLVIRARALQRAFCGA